MEAMEAEAAVTVSKYCSITIPMRFIEGASRKLQLCPAADRDSLRYLHMVLSQETLQIELTSVHLPWILFGRN